MADAFDLNAERDRLAADVRAAFGDDVTVTTDPRATNLPCVLVGEPAAQVSDVRTVTVIFPVVIMTAPPGNDASLRWRMAQLSILLPAVRGAVEWRPENYDVGDRRLPATVVLYSRPLAYC